MSGRSIRVRRVVAVILIATTCLGAFSGVAAAETRTGGQVVIDAEQEKGDVTAFAGTVIVRGTVDGDLEAFAGNVVIESGGEVTGDVEAVAGNVQIDGTVGGSVSATGGNVFVGATASIGGPLEASAGTITVAGSVDGNAKLAGGSVTLAPTAVIDGNLEYSIDDEGTFDPTNATVTGSTTERENLSIGGGFDFDAPNFAGPIFGVYGFLVNLVVGALLLLVLPRTSDRIANLAEDEPLRTGGAGLLALFGVPIGLVLVALTIVGIPLSLAGLLAFVLSVWIASIYGRFAVGSLILSYTDVDNRWAALGVGLVAVAVLVRIPFLGSLLEFLVLLLGLGAMATLLYRFVRNQQSGEESEPVEEPAPA